jgi:hypothetical protein
MSVGTKVVVEMSSALPRFHELSVDWRWFALMQLESSVEMNDEAALLGLTGSEFETFRTFYIMDMALHGLFSLFERTDPDITWIAPRAPAWPRSRRGSDRAAS